MKIRLNGQRRFFVSKNFPPFIVSRERRADFPEGYFYFICRKTASQISLKRKFTAMFRRVSSNANVNVCCACFNIFCAEDSRVIFSENKQFRHVAKSIKMFYKKKSFSTSNFTISCAVNMEKSNSRFSVASTSSEKNFHREKKENQETYF